MESKLIKILDRLTGIGLLIKIPKSKNSAISKSDIQSFEKKFAKFPNHSSIFFYTDGRKISKRKLFS